MKNLKLLDLYSDYLLVTFGQATATGLSALLGQEISHDQVQRTLAGEAQTSADLWRLVKPFVRQVEKPHGILVIDDSISEKPFTDENELICWHYDHSKGINVKGINFVSCLYHCDDISLPVGFELVQKTEHYIDTKSGKKKRRSKKTKNEIYRDLLSMAVKNQIAFKYVTNDSWFSSAENIVYCEIKPQQRRGGARENKPKGSIELGRQAKWPLSESRQAATGRNETGYRLCVRRQLSIVVGETSLYKQRWFYRHFMPD